MKQLYTPVVDEGLESLLTVYGLISDGDVYGVLPFRGRPITDLVVSVLSVGHLSHQLHVAGSLHCHLYTVATHTPVGSLCDWREEWVY